MAYQFTQTGAEIQDILDLARLQIAAPYDSASSYTAGDYCTKDDGFYVCTASTSGTWDASKWSAVTVGDVLETANANISSLNATLTQLITSGSWTPTISRANVTSSSGKWVKIGSIVFLQALITFNSSQTAKGNIYIDSTSLPSAITAANVNIHGAGGTGTYSFSLSNYANKNIWIAQIGVGRIQANASSLPGESVYFSMTVVPR